jgi:hypothetical protein
MFMAQCLIRRKNSSSRYQAGITNVEHGITKIEFVKKISDIITKLLTKRDLQ